MSERETDLLDRAELRTLFLFEALTDEQLDWLAEQGRVERRRGGDDGLRRGGAGDLFLRPAQRHRGAVAGGSVARRSRSTRTSQRGVYGGALRAYLPDDAEQQFYANTLRAITDCELFVLPATAFATAMRSWFPMAVHLLEGLFYGMREPCSPARRTGAAARPRRALRRADP